MRSSTRKAVAFFLALASLFFIPPAFSELPEGVVVEEKFIPGPGEAVGKVVLVKGKVVIMHAGEKKGYWAIKDLPLFNGDVIVTLKKARISFVMNDGSVVTLASDTKLVINMSALDKPKKTHSTFLGMELGKARFRVKKSGVNRATDFRVKTRTALVRVDGSDFVVKADEKSTSVFTFEDTRLEVMNLAGPCAGYWDFESIEKCGGERVSLSAFEKVVIDTDTLVPIPEKILPEDIEDVSEPKSIRENPPPQRAGNDGASRHKVENALERQEEIPEILQSPSESDNDLPAPPNEPEEPNEPEGPREPEEPSVPEESGGS